MFEGSYNLDGLSGSKPSDNCTEINHDLSYLRLHTEPLPS